MTATTAARSGDPATTPVARPWFGGLEAIRFFAAFVVVLHHAGFATGATFRWSEGGAVPGQLIARLDVGVTIFFVLSGFVLFRPYADDQLAGRSPQPTVPFWIRRASRIFPAYWAALLVQLAVGVVAVSGLGGFLATFWLAQTYFSDTVLQGITQAWTLCVELGFYLTLPWLAAIARRWTARGTVADQATRLLVFCAGLAGFSVVFRLGMAAAFPRSESRLADMALLWTPAHLDAFGAGMAIAVVSAWTGHQPMVRDAFTTATRRIGVWWAAAAAAFWFVSTQFDLEAGLELVSIEREILRQTLYVVVAVAIITPVVAAATPRTGGADDAEGRPARSRLITLLEHPAAIWLGSLTYGIYLWHQAVISWTMDLFDWQVVESGNFLIVATFATLGSIVIAVVSRRLVEDPVQRLVRSRLGRARPDGVSAGAAS